MAPSRMVNAAAAWSRGSVHPTDATIAARRILTFAATHTALWRHRAPADYTNRSWPELPTMSRTDIHERFEETVADGFVTRNEAVRRWLHVSESDSDDLHVFLSAGADRILVPFVTDAEAWDAIVEATLRRFFMAGVVPTAELRVAFVGTSDPRHTLPRIARGLGSMIRPAIAGFQEGIESMIEQVSSFEPDVLFGLPSAISTLARAQLSGRLRLTLQACFSSGEALAVADRQQIERAWSLNVFDAYQSTEGGVVASQCSAGRLHVNEDLVQLELEGGASLLTNLRNHAQPIVRYRLSDQLGLEREACPCGLATQTCHLSRGRSAVMWRLPALAGDDVLVHPVVIRSVLDGFGTAMSPQIDVTGNEIGVQLAPELKSSAVLDQLREALERAGVDVKRLGIAWRDP